MNAFFDILDHKSKLSGLNSLHEMGLSRSFIKHKAELRVKNFDAILKFCRLYYHAGLHKTLPLVFRPRIEMSNRMFNSYCREKGFSGPTSKKFDINTWILHSEMIIHDQCTSSIESALSRTPSISIGKYTDIDCEPVRDSTVFIEDPDSLVEFIRNNTYSRNSSKHGFEDLVEDKYNITASNFFNADTSSSAHIVNAVNPCLSNSDLSCNISHLRSIKHALKSHVPFSSYNSICKTFSRIPEYMNFFSSQRSFTYNHYHMFGTIYLLST